MGTITVNRTELGKALDFASLGLGKYHYATPIMGGMRVTIDGGALELAAFDMETAALAKVAGEADGPGRVLVCGSELAAVIKSLPKGAKVRAEITVEDDGLIVLCDGIEAVLSSLPIGEYPQLPPLPAESGLVNSEAFARSVARVAAAAGRDDTLPALLGIKFTSDHGRLELAATDRCRLAVDEVTWTGPDGTDALIDARTLTAFAKKADKHGKISLHFGDKAGVSDGTRTLITRLIPGEFPKFRSLIPAADDATTTVLVDAAALGAAVTRAGKLLERNTPATLIIGDDGITVQAWRDGALAGSQVVAAVLDGDPTEIRFCPAYLADTLAGVDGEAYLSLRSPVKPALITSADEADRYAGVCMPIRLNA